MGTREDKQLEAARSLIRDVADRLDLDAWARLWDGTRLPLGKAPTSNFEIAISDPGVIGAILRSPRLDTIIRQYVEKGIAWAHFDTYAWNQKNRPGRPKGGEALLLRACYAMIKERFA